MTIETERSFNSTSDTVYQAWISEETLVRPVTRIEKDVRIGGYYRLYVEMENATAVMEAKYREVETGRKLVYRWEWNRDGEVTEVAVEGRSSAGVGSTVGVMPCIFAAMPKCKA